MNPVCLVNHVLSIPTKMTLPMKTVYGASRGQEQMEPSEALHQNIAVCISEKSTEFYRCLFP